MPGELGTPGPAVAPGTPLRRVIDTLPRPLRRQRLLRALCALRLVSPIQLLEFNGNARAFVDLRDAESRANYLVASFWPEVHPMVAAFLRKGGDFFDVGANFGLVTFGVVPLVRGLGIGMHLFEANWRIVPLLERSAEFHPDERFLVNLCCVTERPGVSRLLAGDSWGSAFISDRGSPIPNLLLDDYVTEHNIQRIAFMKMDIEGCEPFALRGARRTLSSGRVDAGLIEISSGALRRSGSSAEEMLGLLEALGFDLYFCALWNCPDPFDLKWVSAPVNGTQLRFAQASPLPVDFVQDDLLAVHRSTSLSLTIREAFRETESPGCRVVR